VRAVQIAPAVAAGAAGAVVSGGPSTLWALLRGTEPLEATVAAGSIVLPGETRRSRLVAAALPVHVALSLGWAVVLERTLPRRHAVVGGAVAGLAIAAVDLGVLGRSLPRVRALPLLPQLADHLAYGMTVGFVLTRRHR
jgi:drug/metabolite transporter superfamily protein YnfA